MRQAAIDWLAAFLTHTDDSNSLLGSLAGNYGAQAVAQLLASLSATDSMAILQRVIPAPLAQADLDWSDFIKWRLELESELIAARAEDEWLRLYDTSDADVRRAAYERDIVRNPPSQRLWNLVVDQVHLDQRRRTSLNYVLPSTVTKRASCSRHIASFNMVNGCMEFGQTQSAGTFWRRICNKLIRR